MQRHMALLDVRLWGAQQGRGGIEEGHDGDRASGGRRHGRSLVSGALFGDVTGGALAAAARLH
jgi:hypothetical protein